ncbi:LysR substrate-binding domain-containing protein [Cupriavidus sp. amp6]|uniref:LysR substrate-binding domain-containing protein n=1 Tax=Cupriavidus sp. amp6 TaxID=388051 RepID=UPI000416222C|nr:LysR substrate-binding domain-containing protein [Cupriavidus sp. amp6]
MITVEQVEALKSGRIDLGFGRIAINDPAIHQQVVLAEHLVAALPQNRPAPHRRALTPEGLAPKGCNCAWRSRPMNCKQPWGRSPQM